MGVSAGGSTAPTDLRFTGQREEGFGLYDYGARFYSPGLGRFVSADTLVPDAANPQDFNRYSYAASNPLRYIDPSGNQIEPIEYQQNAIQYTGTTGSQTHNMAEVFHVNKLLVSYPSVQTIEALAIYHQHQGYGTSCCGDYSIAMSYNIWYDRSVLRPVWPASPEYKKGFDITPLIDNHMFGRFPDGGSTPWGMARAFEELGIPFSRNMFGSLSNLRWELSQNHVVVISIGSLKILGASQNWGHVIVVLGYHFEQGYGILDPGSTEKKVIWLSEEQLLKQWWYDPIHPMWVLGEEKE